MGEPDFSKFKTVIHDLILEGEKNFSNHQKWQWSHCNENFFMQRERNQQLH